MTKKLSGTVQRPIFVFGSNTQGRHGAGTALMAKQSFGAINGQASGMQGRSYAIVTKELRQGHKAITLEDVRKGVRKFFKYAGAHPELLFIMTKVGCGLAGFQEDDIKGMMRFAPENVVIPRDWTK